MTRRHPLARLCSAEPGRPDRPAARPWPVRSGPAARPPARPCRRRRSAAAAGERRPRGHSPRPAAPVPPFQQPGRHLRTAARAQGTRADSSPPPAGLAPIPTVTEANENQPEFSRPVWAYLDSAASARRIEDGQFLLAKNRSVIDAIAARSGVPQEILVAIWGMETDFGRVLGQPQHFRGALATLG